MGSPEDSRELARNHFEAERFEESREAALAGLALSPDDVELLILAGRAGLEIGAGNAILQFRRATELAPDSAAVWRYLGEAHAAEGQTAEAGTAFRRVIELDPFDEVALTHLGHTSVAAERTDDAVRYRAKAAEIRRSSATSTAVSLVEMYRSFGQYERALEQALKIAAAAPGDILAVLDVAELSFRVGRLDDAGAAFERLRDLDHGPGREVYPLRGLIAVEIRRGDWARAQELAQELAAQAPAIEPHALSADLAAFLREQIDGPGPEPAPTAEEVEAALASSIAAYLRMTQETLHPGWGIHLAP